MSFPGLETRETVPFPPSEVAEEARNFDRHVDFGIELVCRGSMWQLLQPKSIGGSCQEACGVPARLQTIQGPQPNSGPGDIVIPAYDEVYLITQARKLLVDACGAMLCVCI